MTKEIPDGFYWYKTPEGEWVPVEIRSGWIAWPGHEGESFTADDVARLGPPLAPPSSEPYPPWRRLDIDTRPRPGHCYRVDRDGVVHHEPDPE